MQDERNQDQITRKDARDCFVESLRDCVQVGRMQCAFASYGLTRPPGQRQTNQIQIYIPVGEFLNLCRKLECGELRYLMQSRKQSGDRRPIYETLGGTSAEKLTRQGRPRPDGRSLSRTMQILCGSKSDLLLVADSGPGDTTDKGLIVPKFGKNPENHVAVSMRSTIKPGSAHGMLHLLPDNPSRDPGKSRRTSHSTPANKTNIHQNSSKVYQMAQPDPSDCAVFPFYSRNSFLCAQKHLHIMALFAIIRRDIVSYF